MSNKRPRSAGGGPGMTAQKRGQMAGARFSKGLPWSEYGAMRVKRGTDENIARFGNTYRAASEAQRQARTNHRYSGRGMYTGRGSYFGKALGSALGSVGSKFLPIPGIDGGKFGGFVGDKAGDLLGMGMYTGRGSYAKTNEMMAGSVNSSPAFASVPDESGSLIVSHKEYIGDIYAPAAAAVGGFVVQAFPINPGLEQAFPWLSQIAQNYEEYELIQSVYQFQSTVQDVNSANGQVGTIICATNYNPSAPIFSDKPSMAAYAHSVSGKSTDNITSGVECDPTKVSGSAGKFVRANPVLTGEDLKSYDHGTFQIATHNIPVSMASGTLGELYCTYTVKLRKPKFFTGRGLGLTRFLSAVTKDADCNKEFPMGLTEATMLRGQQNNLAIKMTPSTNQCLFTIPAYYAGRLRIIAQVESSDNSLTGMMLGGTVGTAGNVILVNDMYGASNQYDSPFSTTQSLAAYGGIAIVDFIVQPSTNAIDNKINITFGITGGNLSGSSIDISEYNSFGSDTAPVMVNSAGAVVVTPTGSA